MYIYIYIYIFMFSSASLDLQEGCCSEEQIRLTNAFEVPEGLQAPDIGGRQNLCCRKAMHTFGSH